MVMESGKVVDGSYEATRRKTRVAVEVMLAYLDGQPIEFRCEGRDWGVTKSPVWDWNGLEYRVAPVEGGAK